LCLQPQHTVCSFSCAFPSTCTGNTKLCFCSVSLLSYLYLFCLPSSYCWLWWCLPVCLHFTSGHIQVQIIRLYV